MIGHKALAIFFVAQCKLHIGFALHKDSMGDLPENLDGESSIDENAVKISHHIPLKFGKGNSVKIPASLLVKDWVHTDMAYKHPKQFVCAFPAGPK